MPISYHIPKWISRAVPDYYTLFIQSWIPYNAWYHKEIAPIAGPHDRDCINHICANPNTYKNKIMSLLVANNDEGEQFRKDVAGLHNALLAHTIPDTGRQLTFSTIKQGGLAELVAQGNYYNFFYKVERVPVGNDNTYDILVEHATSHVTKYSTRIGRHQNFDIVESDRNFTLLSSFMQNKIREFFAKVNPQAPCNIVLQPIRRGSEQLPPSVCIVMDAKTHVYFINDNDKIAQMLIRLIYKLRCELFHGSIDPSDANAEVFEYLYKVQSRLIQEFV